MIHELTMWDGIKQFFTLTADADADATLGSIIGTVYILWLTVDQERILYYIKFLNTVLLWPPHSFVVVQVSQ